MKLARSSVRRRARVGFALALLPPLSGCLAAVAIPLVAGGTLTLRQHHVRAATQVPALATAREREAEAIGKDSKVTLTDLTALPPPDAIASAAADDPWQRFFAYALTQVPAAGDAASAADGKAAALSSALLVASPSLDEPKRRACPAQFPAVVIDLDDGATAFAPEHLGKAPAAVVQGLAKLRQAGVVVLWISQLPAARARDVAAALRGSGLDPTGQDQLLLVRGADDRKQLLRQDANGDVCIVAIAGDKRGDFDELFDYLRNPDAAVGLYPMMDNGWFLVPPLDGTGTGASGE
jgi:hypothetical protein